MKIDNFQLSLGQRIQEPQGHPPEGDRHPQIEDNGNVEHQASPDEELILAVSAENLSESLIFSFDCPIQ